MDLTAMIVREIDIVTTVARLHSDIPAALQMLADGDVASVTAGPRIALAARGTRPHPLAEQRATGRSVTPAL
jgi:hypothetical protein